MSNIKPCIAPVPPVIRTMLGMDRLRRITEAAHKKDLEAKAAARRQARLEAKMAAPRSLWSGMR